MADVLAFACDSVFSVVAVSGHPQALATDRIPARIDVSIDPIDSAISNEVSRHAQPGR